MRIGTEERSRSATTSAIASEEMSAAAPQSSMTYWSSDGRRWLLIAV